MENESKKRDQLVVDAFLARMASPTKVWTEQDGRLHIRGAQSVTLAFSEGFIENFLTDLRHSQAEVVVGVLTLAQARAENITSVNSAESQDVFPDGRMGNVASPYGWAKATVRNDFCSQRTDSARIFSTSFARL